MKASYTARVIHAAFRLIGLEVKRIRASDVNRFVWLQQKPIRTVIDIGANTGQFAAIIHGLFPRARIYGFEPLPDCYQQLMDNMGGVPGFVAFNVALGDQDGEGQMHRHSFTPSSSLLPSSPLLTRVFPHTGQDRVDTVSVRRLDTIATQLELEHDLLVKIDVQGYEDRVIRGGKKVLSLASVLIVETSFARLYEGQILFDGIYDIVQRMGFHYAGSLDQIASPLDGRILQADSVFIRDGQLVGGHQ
jgi:FkbM family methyltransferase